MNFILNSVRFMKNMDEQEINSFKDLYIKFQEICRYIAKILSEYDCDFIESSQNAILMNWKKLR